LSGQLIATFKGHAEGIEDATLSPDGRRLVIASNDGTARQYLVELDDLLAEAACRVGRGLASTELAEYGVDAPRFDMAGRWCASGR
jgi:hypothetical protein